VTTLNLKRAGSKFEILSTVGNEITYFPMQKLSYETAEDVPVSTINYDMMNSWWQMDNLPSYMKGWQAISQIMNKFNKMDFLNFYYSDLLYHGYYGNFVWAQANALSDFTVADRQAIYYDKQFGMSSIRNLTAWVAASRSNSDISAPAMEMLEGHYFSGSVKLNSTQIAKINTKMVTLIAQVDTTLVNNKLVASASDITSSTLGIMQMT